MARRRQALSVGCLLIASLATNACSLTPQPDGSRGTASTVEPEPPPGWSEYRSGIPEDLGYEPSSTDWTGVDTPNGTLPCAESPRNAIDHWIEFMAMTGNGHQRVLLEEGNGDVTGVMQRWGFKDDSVFGSDHRLQIDGGAGCWQVAEAEVRWYCRRGVSEAGLCL